MIRWHDPGAASYWALKYLSSYTTKEEAYQHIKNQLKTKAVILKRRVLIYIYYVNINIS